MFSILDILKKSKQEKKRIELEAASGNNPDLGSNEGAPAPGSEEKPAAGFLIGKDNVNLSSVLTKEIINENARLLGEHYKEAHELALQIYSSDLKNFPEFKAKVSSLIERMTALISIGTKESLRFSLSDYPENDNYLAYHIVNVCFLSLEIGRVMGYDRAALLDLGMAAFLHDIGMTRYAELVNKTEALNADEHKRIKQHPQAGLDILNQFSQEFPLRVFDAISQEHEHLDGSGYPKGLKAEEISEYPQIIGVVDAYEAMTHRRPYRKKYTPAYAINVILNNKKSFSPKVIKVLIETFGIFPAGFLVRLNTKETALVYKNNPTSPLRPQIRVMFDQEGKELKDVKIVDLLTTPLLYIDECLEYFKKPNGE
jgi:HD-GYP domain-containing protein (c-di-GMP phosphodiesterase class II)